MIGKLQSVGVNESRHSTELVFVGDEGSQAVTVESKEVDLSLSTLSADATANRSDMLAITNSDGITKTVNQVSPEDVRNIVDQRIDELTLMLGMEYHEKAASKRSASTDIWDNLSDEELEKSMRLHAQMLQLLYDKIEARKASQPQVAPR